MKLVDAVSKWANDNKMELNAKKTKDMWIGFRKAMREPPKLTVGNNKIERVERLPAKSFRPAQFRAISGVVVPY